VALPPDLVERNWEMIRGLPAAGHGSMLQDLRAGRRLELEALYGAVVRQGEQMGVATPLNFAVYAARKPYADGPPGSARVKQSGRHAVYVWPTRALLEQPAADRHPGCDRIPPPLHTFRRMRRTRAINGGTPSDDWTTSGVRHGGFQAPGSADASKACVCCSRGTLRRLCHIAESLRVQILRTCRSRTTAAVRAAPAKQVRTV
jgi:Ketopantoate reductase PanE/ApbA C terminal